MLVPTFPTDRTNIDTEQRNPRAAENPGASRVGLIHLSDAACSWASPLLGLGLVLVSQFIAFSGLIGGKLVTSTVIGKRIARRSRQDLKMADRWLDALVASERLMFIGMSLCAAAIFFMAFRAAANRRRVQRRPALETTFKLSACIGIGAFLLSGLWAVAQWCIRPTLDGWIGIQTITQ